MKTFTAAAMDEIIAGTAIVSGAVKIYSDPPIRVWGGYGQLSIDVDGVTEQFEPLGDQGLAQVFGGALGGAAQNTALTLSGIDPEALALLDADEVQQAQAVLWRLIFNGAGNTLLDAQIFRRGRLDTLTVEDMIGGAATIKAQIEGAARGLGRRGGRMRTDADQRLIKADDGFFRNVAFAAEKTLHWGGQKPATAGAALGGISPGGVPGGGNYYRGGINLDR